ncbi:hypothetical protein SHIRM173S_00353 [Streptomyces hirsutus]
MTMTDPIADMLAAATRRATTTGCRCRTPARSPSRVCRQGCRSQNSLVKVLGQGEISVALQVTVDAVSGSAKETLTAACGTVTELV